MIKVQLCAAIDSRQHGRHISLGKMMSLALQKVEERGIFEQCNFDCLGHPTAPVTLRECCQECAIIDDRCWRYEGAKKILFSKGIHTILHTHRRVVLRQHGCWYSDQTHTAMSRRCRIPHQIDHSTSTDDHHEGMTADPIVVNSLLNSSHVFRVVFRLFSASNDQGSRYQINSAVMLPAISINGYQQIMMMPYHSPVDHTQD